MLASRDLHPWASITIYLDFDVPFQTLLKAMDVFIPQEYVMRRRTERKAAAGAGKVSEMVSADSGRRSAEVVKKARPPPTFSLENEFLAVSTGLAENVVFTCFSA
jgi:hypothetical protein